MVGRRNLSHTGRDEWLTPWARRLRLPAQAGGHPPSPVVRRHKLPVVEGCDQLVFRIELRSVMALFATRSPHTAERFPLMITNTGFWNAGTSFVIRDPGFHFVSSGLCLLRSRPQLHCASSTVIPSGPVKKNSWRSWNSLSSPRTSTPLDLRFSTIASISSTAKQM